MQVQKGNAGTISPKDFSIILTAAGIEYAEIAERAGVSVPAVSQTLNGKRTQPKTVRKIVSEVCTMIEERAVSSLASAA